MTYTPLVSFAGCLVVELGVVSGCIAFNKLKRWRDVRSMSLEVTREEYNRLEASRTFCKYRKHYKITDSVEEEIIKLIHDEVSTSEIMRTLHVSQGTVIRVRRQNKLWGV